MTQSTPPMVVFVDVDDTLVRTVGSKRIPMVEVVSHVRSLADQGAELYCWSTGGAAYARTAAEELGIAGCFVEFLPKPHVILDDQDVADWRTCLQIHPNQCAGQSLEHYQERLR